MGCMMNPNLSINKYFREQVKLCLKNTFSASTLSHIHKMLLKPDIIVLALVMFFYNRKKFKEIFRVLSCVIYLIIRNYVRIGYLGSEGKIK